MRKVRFNFWDKDSNPIASYFKAVAIFIVGCLIAAFLLGTTPPDMNENLQLAVLITAGTISTVLMGYAFIIHVSSVRICATRIVKKEKRLVNLIGLLLHLTPILWFLILLEMSKSM